LGHLEMSTFLVFRRMDSGKRPKIQ
jgi:hypothetical protein